MKYNLQLGILKIFIKINQVIQLLILQIFLIHKKDWKFLNLDFMKYGDLWFVLINLLQN